MLKPRARDQFKRIHSDRANITLKSASNLLEFESEQSQQAGVALRVLYTRYAHHTILCLRVVPIVVSWRFVYHIRTRASICKRSRFVRTAQANASDRRIIGSTVAGAPIRHRRVHSHREAPHERTHRGVLLAPHIPYMRGVVLVCCTHVSSSSFFLLTSPNCVYARFVYLIALLPVR